MPIPLNKKRHPDILRLLAQRQQAQSNEAERKTLLPGVLDGLNAFGFMEQTEKRTPSSFMCFGPKSIEGEGWLGVVIWYRQKTFHAYKTITVLGTWAIAQDNNITIRVGTQELSYGEQPYNVEAYLFRMRTEFEAYYGNVSAPPETHQCIYVKSYSPEDRLEIRQQLQTIFRNYWQT